MQDSTVITLDLETTGVDWQVDKIILCGYRLNRSGPILITIPTEVDKDLFALLNNPNNILSGANVKFDALFLAAQGYDIRCGLEDTRVMAYCCWPNDESHGLKQLVRSKLKTNPDSLGEIRFKPLKRELKFLEDFYGEGYFRFSDGKWCRKDILEAYHKEDILNVDRLRAIMVPPKWYWEVEYPLTKILFEAEFYGCPLDKEYLSLLAVDFNQRFKQLQEELGECADFNPGSTDQVAKKFKEQGLNLDDYFGKTETGKYSIDKLALKKLAWNGNSFAQTLLEYRRYAKLLSTYIEPFIEGVGRDGRLHGSINQAGKESPFGDETDGTNTGRLSSSDPNLQNIPARTKEGKKIRKAFIASKEEYPFLANSDLEQIEPRLLAHFSQSPVLINAYNNNIDTHSLMASLIFGRSIEEYDKKIIASNPQLYIERFIGKTSWLATAYKCSARKLLHICEINSDTPLKLDLKPYEKAYNDFPRSHRRYPCFPGYPSCQDCIRQEYKKEAEEVSAKWAFFANVQNKFRQANPEIVEWSTNQIERTRALGYVTTLGGRRIPLPDIQLDPLVKGNRHLIKKAERKAINTPIQGSCADALKLIIVKMDRQLNCNGKVLINVHDEVLTLLKSPDLVSIVSDCMENTIRLKNVPVKSSTKLVNSWADKE
jgi:DNA polymerase-1